MDQVPCDLCGATESHPLYTLEDYGYKFPGEFVLRRCDHCQLMYLSPRPTPEAMAAYYPPEYECYRMAIEDERFQIMRWMRQGKLARRRRLVERYSGQRTGRLLDVGCATGLFLHEMAESGWQVAGIEPAASAVEYARRRFSLDVFQGMLQDAPYAPGSFDVVTLWDVLEHTFSPSDNLAYAARLLRPGGLLALTVPNWHCLDRWLFGRCWLGLDPPRHLYVFTDQTLNTMLSQAGFSVLSREFFVSGYFSFVLSLERWLETLSPQLSRTFRWVSGLPGMRFPFEPWFMIGNLLGKGSTVSVFSRKAI